MKRPGTRSSAKRPGTHSYANGSYPPGSSDRPVEHFRAGYVALIGDPNVGKSTLLNRLLGRRLSITARRPQTTRRRLLGILNGPDFQAVLVDTPGLLEPKYRLQELMRRETDTALRDADVVCILLDAAVEAAAQARRDSKTPGHAVLCERRFRLQDDKVGKARIIFAVNKIDLVPREKLLAIVSELADKTPDRVYLISALKGDGVEDLKNGLAAALPNNPPLYPGDMISDRPERFFAAELVREAVFKLYGEELPYSTTVIVEEFSERPGRKDYIRAVIYVERISQRKIIIGRGGAALKRVGAMARRGIESLLGRPVYLELWVKVAENWRRDERFLRDEFQRDN